MVKAVRKFAIGTGITIGAIILLLAASKRFNVGGRLTDAAGGLGSFFPNIGEAFASQFAQGAGSFGETLKSIGENFQRSLGGGLLLSEQEAFGGGGFAGGTANETTLSTQAGQKLPSFLSNAFKAFEPDLTKSTERASNVFNVGNAFTRTAQTRRITQQQTVNQQNNNTTSFGGFGSAQGQETALQKAIAEARAAFPQFFKLPDTGSQ